MTYIFLILKVDHNMVYERLYFLNENTAIEAAGSDSMNDIFTDVIADFRFQRSQGVQSQDLAGQLPFNPPETSLRVKSFLRLYCPFGTTVRRFHISIIDVIVTMKMDLVIKDFFWSLHTAFKNN